MSYNQFQLTEAEIDRIKAKNARKSIRAYIKQHGSEPNDISSYYTVSNAELEHYRRIIYAEQMTSEDSDANVITLTVYDENDVELGQSTVSYDGFVAHNIPIPEVSGTIEKCVLDFPVSSTCGATVKQNNSYWNGGIIASDNGGKLQVICNDQVSDNTPFEVTVYPQCGKCLLLRVNTANNPSFVTSNFEEYDNGVFATIDSNIQPYDVEITIQGDLTDSSEWGIRVTVTGDEEGPDVFDGNFTKNFVNGNTVISGRASNDASTPNWHLWIWPKHIQYANRSWLYANVVPIDYVSITAETENITLTQADLPKRIKGGCTVFELYAPVFQPGTLSKLTVDLHADVPVTEIIGQTFIADQPGQITINNYTRTGNVIEIPGSAISSDVFEVDFMNNDGYLVAVSIGV